MRPRVIELRLLEIPLREPFVAGHGTVRSRTVSVIRVGGDEGHGWGECSALPEATYSGEAAVDSFRALADDLAPRLLGRAVTPGEVTGLLAPAGADRPMAVSALEMAVLDAELRAAGLPLAAWLGAERTAVPAGVSIGMAAIDHTVDRVLTLAADGYRRVKLKIQPGHDRALVESVRAAVPDLEVQVDANGTYGPDDLAHLAALADLGLAAIEQPFPPDDPASAAALVTLLDRGPRDGGPPAEGRPAGRTLVVADEAAGSAADAEALLVAGALTGLSVKPARVGGLLAARTIHDLCLLHRLPATAGGMLETALGRHALAAVAALPGFTLTGDLSPAGRWLVADPWPDLALSDGTIAVHPGPGVAPDPDHELLAALTVEQRTVR